MKEPYSCICRVWLVRYSGPVKGTLTISRNVLCFASTGLTIVLFYFYQGAGISTKFILCYFFSTKVIQVRNWKFHIAIVIEHRNAHENVKRTALYLDQKRSKSHVYLIYYCCPHEKMDNTGILDRQKHWIKTMYGTIICKTALLYRDMKLRVRLMLLTVQIQIR